MLKRTLAASLLIFLAALGSSYAACTDGGGYPWANGDCLYADDINAAIAGRNPLLNSAQQTGKAIVGFTEGVPLFGTVGGLTTIPAPTASTLGGVFAFTAPPGSFITGVTTTGAYTTGVPDTSATRPLPPTSTLLGGVKAFTAPAGSFITGVTITGDYTTGTASVAPGTVPPPTSTTLGGVKSFAPVANNFLTGIDTTGTATAARPTFVDISGMASNSQIPTPTVAQLGGVRSNTAPTNQFATGVSLTGDLVFAQPALAGLSGFGPGVAAFLATPTSALFAAAVTDETGTGPLVFATSPVLTTPNIGVAAGTTLALSGNLTVGSVGVADASIGRNLTVYNNLIIGNGTSNLGLKFAVACGAIAGSAKLVVYGGTNGTPITVVDNVGSGVPGC